MPSVKNKVFLVGAGPGDPKLITQKALECIEKSDVIIYDYLASTALLKHAPKKAELIYVGKKGGEHARNQDKINSLVIRKAKEGLRVTRLKGGDPFIFGRGGEEAEALIEEEIPFEIVPGITSAIAAPAYAGIPLTHRNLTSTVAFVTGHEDPNKNESQIDWASIASGIGTIVFLMGVKNLLNIVQKLIMNGMSSDTPVALIHWGTTSRQMTVTGRLDNIVERVKSSGLKAPSVIVVGDVVNLRSKMKWFENRPLFGKKIAVTRSQEQAGELTSTLSELGAEVLEYPTIKTASPEDFRPLDRAIKNLSTYDWLVFTSINGVSFFFKRLFEQGRDIRILGHLRTAVVGPATEKRLLDFGLKSDIVLKPTGRNRLLRRSQKKLSREKEYFFHGQRKQCPSFPLNWRRWGELSRKSSHIVRKQLMNTRGTFYHILNAER